MDLSIVISVLNEEENVLKLAEKISEALVGSGLDYEIIFVDDGSTDKTVSLLQGAQESNEKLRIIKLRRNYGQTPAMRAGIDHSRGRIVVTMDGDLQNDPKDIPILVSKLEEGYDLVAGWRLDRKDAFLSRKIPSKVANYLIAKITGVPIHDNGCSLKAYRAGHIKRIPLYSEMHRFIPAMTTLAGSRIAEVVVNHHPRRFGVSKYGLSRTGKVILDLMTVKMLIAFSQRPLHWFGLLSMPFVAMSLLCGLYSIFIMLFSESDGVTIVYPALCLLFGFLAIQLTSMGLIGELSLRTGTPHDFREVSQRKEFTCR